ncbi:Myb-like DNA-binding domain containing protein [Trichomonas vaginalis G3]|uniref:Myb-like DNA-binding domain containing protein n=1 Tax=Trichomonas vaginalis (strain ATCC PRA-98 / G3) TaxID=412133 RepID=A2FAM3_TRIV3|nr:RNA polymerase II transcription regulator recruiting protein [Trichomonas vaginalis G3]EAX98066.1 Myb-like DNA-binding domain containing protein [Trichomonas vaginalis G3]KAI5549730.1 RNA polymerase II transcription regulator recruiting protein [Trichomonas vaginalis G3]|eukprot:XP_001310996.1 Myb-like DNA-binding domain containing protein [Trichomonas vaginalis G3]
MSPVGKPHPKDKFTQSEDDKLRLLVQVFGTSNWKKVSEYMVTRNPRQCRDRYKNYLAPHLNSSPWVPEDDAKLLALVQQNGRKWSMIAKEFPGRTDINIKSRYSLLLRQEEREKEKQKLNPTPAPLIQKLQPAPALEFDDSVDLFDFNELQDFDFGF